MAKVYQWLGMERTHVSMAWDGENTCVLIQIFKNLKEVFLSDDANQFWSAWIGVSRANRARNACHFDRAYTN